MGDVTLNLTMATFSLCLACSEGDVERHVNWLRNVIQGSGLEPVVNSLSWWFLHQFSHRQQLDAVCNVQDQTENS